MKQALFGIWCNGRIQYGNETYNQFGVVGKWYESEGVKTRYFSNITNDFEEIVSLVECLNSSQASILHIKDIIEDFVQEKADVNV